jgi:predicted Zn finger-like uncharacterized protein
MSLATRCTACHTTFRVVQDQLKVSEGWVRCGRCNEVFNALEGLFDLERDMPPDDGAGATPPPASSFLAQPSAVELHVTQDTVAQPHALDEPLPSAERGSASAPVRESLARTLAHSRPVTHEAADDTPEVPTGYEVLDSRFLDRSTYGPTQHPEFDDGPADSRLGSVVHEPHEPGAEGTAWMPTTPAPSVAQNRPSKTRVRSGDELVAEPDFLRNAAYEASGQGMVARVMLAIASVLLCVALGGQLALHWRDWLAAHYPESRPLLAQMCRLVQCRIGPLKSIDDVVVDSSSLARGSEPDGYRLTILLRNRSTVQLALPSIDLSLTDADGSVVSRRTLSPADFKVDGVIASRSEVTLNLNLSTPGRRVTGYTVEAFYP